MLHLKLKKLTVCLKNIFGIPAREIWVHHHGQHPYSVTTISDLGIYFEILNQSRDLCKRAVSKP